MIYDLIAVLGWAHTVLNANPSELMPSLAQTQNAARVLLAMHEKIKADRRQGERRQYFPFSSQNSDRHLCTRRLEVIGEYPHQRYVDFDRRRRGIK